MLHQLLCFIYPVKCLYCEKRLENIFSLLCLSCCQKLILLHHGKEKIISCFEKHSPAHSLFKYYLKTESKKTLQLLISYMVVKIYQTGLQMPDLVVSGVDVDVAVFKKPNTYLAQGIAKAFQIPFSSLFFYQLKPQVFDNKGRLCGQVCMKQSQLEGKKIWIIHGRFSSTLQECIELLEKSKVSCTVITIF